ncbi:MAG TPA: nucleoside kinase [Clostridiales bacterium]|nr:nucleoside kinase [Clostridiales bacterium]
MLVRLKTSPESPISEIQVPQGTMLEELVKQYQDKLPFRILAAKVNNRVQELNRPITDPCTVTLLDIRNQSANLIYQRSVSFIYLKAISDLYGKVRVNIENSLNKGLYTEVKLKKPLADKHVAAIEEEMHKIVEQDIPFVRRRWSQEEAFATLSDGSNEEKLRMMRRAPQITSLPIYECDGYLNFFYGQMVPSSGYIKYFEVRRYRNGALLRLPSPESPDRVPPFRDDTKLYKVFGETKKRYNLMDISYVSDLNQSIESGRYRDIILMAEAFHEKKIAQIADQIMHENKRIVLISGPSSSGKTTFAKRLVVQLMVNGKKPLYLGTDDYFLERHETPRLPSGEYNFEDLEAIDVKLFNENMRDLLAGQEVDLPSFSFKEGSKLFGQRIERLQKDQPIVIEGIHGLNDALTPSIPAELKFKIYISPLTGLNIDNHNRIPTTDARLLRRIVRDDTHRNYTADMTIMQWPKVRAAEDKNIFAFNSFADVLFNSAFVYELAILKNHAQPLLEAIPEDNPAYSEAIRILKFLRFFDPLTDETYVANNSILREFIGGSIFV